MLAVGAASIASSAWAELRSGSFRVGFLFGGLAFGGDHPWLIAFYKELGDLGYAKDQNLIQEAREARGEFGRLPSLVAELIALQPDVIVANSTPALMALFKGHCSIPVVFLTGLDPVQLGVAESISRPGSHYTGVFNTGSETGGKQLQIPRSLLPGASRVAIFINPANNPAVVSSVVEKIRIEAARLGFLFNTIEVTGLEGLPRAFATAVEQDQNAVLVPPDPLFFSNHQKIIALARERKLPAMYTFRIEAADGGLIAYGADVEAQYRTVAIYVDKILRGQEPADLPIEQASKLLLVINLKTARELGLEVPPMLLAEADDLIE
jgi:putative tryptophan/tyrosine transport system substrate-binding protein